MRAPPAPARPCLRSRAVAAKLRSFAARAVPLRARGAQYRTILKNYYGGDQQALLADSTGQMITPDEEPVSYSHRKAAQIKEAKARAERECMGELD